MESIDHISQESVNQEINALENEAGPDPADQEKALAAAEDQDQYKDLLVMVLHPLFQILAPGWNVQDEETDQLAQAYAGLLNKYFPGGATQFGPEIGAGMITLAVIGPRLASRVPRKPAPAPAKNPSQEEQSKGGFFKKGGDGGSK